jgi:hypothetical protein
MKSNLIAELGGFNENYKIASDWDLIVRAMQISKPATWVHPLGLFELGGMSQDNLLLAHLELKQIIGGTPNVSEARNRGCLQAIKDGYKTLVVMDADTIFIKEGVLTIGRNIGEIESNMERAANIEIGYMEKKLGQLGLIAGIAPTLGFIGTISGVIKIFYSISVTEDISIGNISGGLYEKMISSGAGLIVGIIAYSAYHLFNGKIDDFSLSIQKQVLEFINIIQRPNGHKAK